MSRLESTTDRQERIPFFNQELLRKSKIGVIGAGATGNEVLKNLALVGWGYVYITDMDQIETSNLSRTVLFTKDDLGKSKARLARERFMEMSIDNGKADYLDGDIAHSLGDGVIRHLDLVIGCVDNDQTRLYVSNICQLVGTPFIDIGIHGFDWHVLSISGKTDCPCFACTIGQKNEEQALERIRNSCDVTRKEAAKEDKVPTIVLSASDAAGDAVKKSIYISHLQNGCELNGFQPDFGTMKLYDAQEDIVRKIKYSRVRKDCQHHESYNDYGGITETPMSAHWKLKDVLNWVRDRYEGEYELSIHKDAICADRSFVTMAQCKVCGKEIEVYRPQPLQDKDLVCDFCREHDFEPLKLSNAIVKNTFSLSDNEKLLEMSLLELGIPLLHIVEFSPLDESKNTLFLELTGDMEEVFPNMPK